MNILLYELASGEVNGNNIKIEDNIGESIHIHYNSFRIELTIEEFRRLSEELSQAKEEI